MMKVALLFIIIMLSFGASAENEDWLIRTTDSICNIRTLETVDIANNKYVTFLLAFAISSKEHKIDQPLLDLNLKPNEYILQMTVTVKQRQDRPETEDIRNFTFDHEIIEPIQVFINNKRLMQYENEYGVTYYLGGSEVIEYMDKIASDKPLYFHMQSKSIGKSIPIEITKKRFLINHHLLKSCANFFA